MRMLPRFDLFYLVSLWTDNTGTLRASFTTLSLSLSLFLLHQNDTTSLSYFFPSSFLSFSLSLSLLSLSLLARIHISWRRILKGLHKVKIDAWLKVYSVARFVPFRCAGSCARYTPPGETKVDIAKYVSRRLFFVIRPTFSTCCASNLIYSTRRESFNGMFQCNS